MSPLDPFASLESYGAKDQSRLTPDVSSEDLDAAIRTVWGEASGGSPEEMAAVANVIRNRTLASGKTPTAVVQEEGQFEPWSRPERRQQMLDLQKDSPEYQQVERTVKPVFQGQMADITGGATHFYAPEAQRALGREPPKWAAGGNGKRVGRQVFYSLPYGETPKAAAQPSSEPFANVPEYSIVPPFPTVPTYGAPTPEAAPGLIESTLEAGKAGIQRGFQEAAQTAQVAMGKAPTALPTPEPYAQNITWEDLADTSSLIPKLAYGLGVTSPELAVGVAAGGAGEAVGGPLVGLGAGTVGFGMASAAKSLGPFYAEELQKSPTEPDAAFDRAVQNATAQGVISGASWAAFGLAPFRGAVRNLLFQAFAVQPTVAGVGKAVTEGEPLGKAMLEAYPGAAVGTAVPALGHGGVKLLGKQFGGLDVRAETSAGEPDLSQYGQLYADVKKERDTVAESFMSGYNVAERDAFARRIEDLTWPYPLTPEEEALRKDIQTAINIVGGGEAPKEEVIHSIPRPIATPEQLAAATNLPPGHPLAQRPAPADAYLSGKVPLESVPSAKKPFGPPMSIEERKTKLGFKVIEGGKAESKLVQPLTEADLLPALAPTQRPQNTALHAEAYRLGKALMEIKGRLGIKTPLRIQFVSDLGDRSAEVIRSGYGLTGRGARVRTPMQHTIRVAVDSHTNAAHIWSSMTHELGHVVVDTELKTAPKRVQMSLLADYRNWRRGATPNESLRAKVLQRDSVGGLYRTMVEGKIWEFSPETRRYWLSYDEFLAEGFAKWATSAEKPRGAAERWVKGISNKLRDLFRYARDVMDMPIAPNVEYANWLNSLMTKSENTGADLWTGLAAETTRTNVEAQLRDGFAGVPVPETIQTQPTRNLLTNIFGGNMPPSTKSMAAHADRFTKFMEWSLGVHQVAELNKGIPELRLYDEDARSMERKGYENMRPYEEASRMWGNLPEAQSDRLVNLLDDYSNMTYLSPEEVARRVVRKPTQEELQKLIKTHKVSKDGIRVFASVTDSLTKSLGEYKRILVRDAAKIGDPKLRDETLQALEKRFEEYGKIPYFPWMRFGDYVVVLRNAAGKVVQREHYDTERKMHRAAEALDEVKPGDHTVSTFVVPKTARAFVGMPPGLLDKIAEKLGYGGHLTAAQERDLRRTLEQLRFDYAPGHSFKHRFQRKGRTPGYSRDFKRAFAAYGFYGARHLARVEFVDGMREHVKNIREQGQTMREGAKRTQIANFLDGHLSELLDPTADFPHLRSLAFFWHLGWMPISAFINLTQGAVTTYPLLGSKFGDARAIGAMGWATRQLSTFYKEEKLRDITDRQVKMLGVLSRDGYISEARAPELAAVSDGRNLLKGFGGNTAEKAMNWLGNSGAFFFSMAEQANRRIAGRSALKLALDHPETPFVREQVGRNPRYYEKLLQEGWTETEAAAIVTAAKVIDDTQFRYSREVLPKLFQGKRRTLFTFKTFQQSMLFFMYNYPAAAVRSALVTAYLGGLMGLPFAEDARDILKMLAWWGRSYFGKDFDIEVEARKYIQNVVGGEKSVGGYDVDPSDLILHGTGTYSFGVPAIFNSMGMHVPTFDVSRAVGMGQVSPVPLSELFGAPTSPDRALSDSLQQMSGASFGIFFTLWRGLQDIQASGGFPDWKTAEKLMPRALGRISRAIRYGTEGMERDKSGAAVVKFDPHDAEGMAELLGVAMGFTPRRLQANWDAIIAKSEAEAYWQLRKQILMRQADVAFRGGDQDQIDRVVGAIRKFNADLPKEAKGVAITTKGLKASLQTRARMRAEREAGVPQSRQNIGLSGAIQRLYPEATGPVEVKRVN